MSVISDRIRIFLKNISLDDDVEKNLADLKVALLSFGSSERALYISDFPFSILFDCLNSSNKEQITLTCEVLQIVLPILPVTQLVTQNGSRLIRALGHPLTEVKVVILDELIRTAGNDSLTSFVDDNTTLLTSVGQCLCHEDAAVGNRAVKFFTKYGRTKKGLTSLCQPVVIKELMENIGNNNVYVLRIFEVLVELGAGSDDSLKYLETEGLLDRISTFLLTDDILAMLALVELCTKMAVTPHGWEFLNRNGIMKHLVAQFVSYEDNPLSSLTFPGLSNFFGLVGQTNSRALHESYPEVLQCTFKAVDSDDLNIFIPALEVIGTIAYSEQGKLVLQKQDERLMRHVMGRLYEGMTKLPIEWRVRALHTVANIVHIEAAQNGNVHFVERMRFTETWFNQLGIHGLRSIKEMAEQPFPELKAAALLVLLNLANQKWGVSKIYESNLLEFLLNRRTENEAPGLQMKYSIVKSMAETRTCDSIFSAGDYESLLEYVRQGPFYSEAVNEVAIEGAE